MLVGLLYGYGLMAQDMINTDRPDQSDGTHTLRKRQVQLETGVLYARLDEFTRGFDNSTLIRFGVSKAFEIRFLNQYSVVRDSGYISGIRPLTISFKNLLWVQHGWLPKVALVSYFRLPVTISQNFPGDRLGYSFILAGRNELSSNLKLYSNIGFTHGQEANDISYPAALELNDNLTEKLSVFVEYFASYQSRTLPSNGIDTGVIYALKNNFAIDLAVGSSTLKISADRFLSVGFSYRTSR